MAKKVSASQIDHTLLKADATRDQIRRICAEAREYRFASVCVNSCHAALVTKELQGSGVKTCCVVGFPLGAMQTTAKALEAKDAVRDGASEIDMVINVGALKEGDTAYVTDDIAAVVDAVKKASGGSGIVKVIIETCLLTDDEKVTACKCAEKAGAAFVKTSTGFSTGGATAEDVALMKKTVGDRLKVKASGGIRTHADALKMIEAGADRIGASSGIALLA